jgi:pimeloyl-ACP methyl ester carboxylesterase
MMQSETICISKLNLCYRTLGRGPDILFLHGWASSGRTWQGIMQALAANFRCWAVDLAGFGDSDKPTNGWYALPNYTASVREFAETVGLQRPHVVGHSMGGMIALDLAADYPDWVRRLVVVNPVVTGQVRYPLPPLDQRPARWPILALARASWPWVMRFAAQHPVKALSAGRSLIRNSGDMAKATVDSAFGSLQAIADYDVTPRLGGIRAPTLVCVGEHDPVVSPAEGRLAAACIPNARLETWPTGHNLFEERLGEFQALLSAFLSAPD